MICQFFGSEIYKKDKGGNTMNAKELNRKLEKASKAVIEAEKALETVIDEKMKFIAVTKDFDVVVGQEGCEKPRRDSRILIRTAKKIFIFRNVPYSHRDMKKDGYGTSRQLLEKNEGVNSEPYDPNAEFSQVVLFLGFCNECFRPEYEAGKAAADILRQRDDLIIMFYGLHPF